MQLAILGYIPKRPQDRSTEALWEYVGQLEEALRHLSLNIDGENMEGVMNQMAGRKNVEELAASHRLLIRRVEKDEKRIGAQEQTLTQLGQTVTQLGQTVTQLGQTVSGIGGRTTTLEQNTASMSQTLQQMNTVVSAEATLNASNANSGTLVCRKIGRLAFVSVNNLKLKQQITADTAVATLPWASEIVSYAAGIQLNSEKSITMYVNGNSAQLMVSRINSPGTNDIWATLIYLTSA